MNKFTTTISKRDGNWRAESTTMVDDTNLELSICTMRAYDGAVRTRASVSRIEGHFKTRTVGISGEGDFSVPMMAMRYPRATEKTIRTQHDTCMAQAESVLYQVRDHYAKQKAAAAPVAATVDGDAEVTA